MVEIGITRTKSTSDYL